MKKTPDSQPNMVLIQGRGKNAPRVAAVLSLLTLGILIGLIPLEKASALTIIPPIVASDTALKDIAWHENIPSISVNSVLQDPDFDKDDPNLSIVIINHPLWSQPPAPTSSDYTYGIIYTREGKLQMSKNAEGNYRVDCPAGSDCYAGTIHTALSISTYRAENNGKCPWAINCAENSYYKLSGYVNSLIKNGTTRAFTTNAGPLSTGYQTMGGIVLAKNVEYTSSWDITKAYNTKINFAGEVQCGSLDVVCKLSKVWSGVSDTFVDVGKRIVDGIVSIFIPDSDELKKTTDELNAFIDSKLGFLAYPRQSIEDIYHTFTTGDVLCTQTSCVKNFGALWGHNLVIDFSQPAKSFPTLWVWLRGFLIGFTVIAMISNLYEWALSHIRRGH